MSLGFVESSLVVLLHWIRGIMKSKVLARPNLKLFLLGAILVAVLQQFMINGDALGGITVQARSIQTAINDDSQLAGLLDKASKHPSCELYGQISYVYERRGDFRKALVYFRAAQVLAEAEENN
jgi:hypothetical protein